MSSGGNVLGGKARGGNVLGGNVLGEKCPRGEMPGGKCPGGKRPGGKRPGGKRPRIDCYTCLEHISITIAPRQADLLCYLYILSWERCPRRLQ